MLIETLSTPLSKWQIDNSLAVDAQIIDFSSVEPSGDGIHRIGYGGSIAPEMVLLVPYCQGSPGSEFTMRVWGWWHAGAILDTENVVWVPLLLAEVLCVAGSNRGLGQRIVRDSDCACDTLTLLSGDLGKNGMIVQPGPGRIAYLKLHLHGCQKFQLEFQQGEDPPAFGNALWAKTSAF